VYWRPPPGWALAQDLFRFFTNAGSDTVPITMVVGTLETPDYAATPVWNPWNMSVADAETLAGYSVITPAVLPDGFRLIGASYQSDDHAVSVFYQYQKDLRSATLEPSGDFLLTAQACVPYCMTYPDESLDLVTTQQPSTPGASLFAELVGSSAKIETVRIGDFTGEYVEGGWTLQNPVAVWDPNPWWRTLRWQVDNMLFEIMIAPGTPNFMKKDDMILWAEQMLP
jgi:hypothetical protein